MILFVIINSILLGVLCYYLLFVRVSFACGVWLLVQLSGREESLLLWKSSTGTGTWVTAVKNLRYEAPSGSYSYCIVNLGASCLRFD